MDENMLFQEYGKLDAKQEEAVANYAEILKGLKEAYDKENDINYRLDYDEALQNEYAACLSMLLMVETNYEESDDPEMFEQAYLKTIDYLIRLAKVIHPISGFGGERLATAYEFLDTFEEKYHPLLTAVTVDNLDSFANLLSPKMYEEVRFGRKKAIGALRLKGTDTYGVGICVYSPSKAPVFDSTVIRLEYIYVHEDFRRFGTGNLLMAALVRPMLKDPDARVVFSYMPKPTSDEDDPAYAEAVWEEFDATEEFLTSWRYDFSLGLSREFFVRFDDLTDSDFLKVTTKGVKSLTELGEHGAHLLEHFCRGQNHPYVAEILSTNMDYFDKDASCVFCAEEQVKAIFLLHKYKDGDYRVCYLWVETTSDALAAMRLIKHAYESVRSRGDVSAIFSGESSAEESYQLLQKLAPKAQGMYVFDGILSPLLPSETLSEEEWEELRKEAGFPNYLSEAEEENTEIDSEKLLQELKNYLDTF